MDGFKLRLGFERKHDDWSQEAMRYLPMDKAWKMAAHETLIEALLKVFFMAWLCKRESCDTSDETTTVVDQSALLR